MKEQEITLGELFDYTVENLPEGWEFTFSMTKAEVSLSLIDPDGDSVEVHMDDQDTGETIQSHVNHARKAEGLPPALFPGATP